MFYFISLILFSHHNKNKNNKKRIPCLAINKGRKGSVLNGSALFFYNYYQITIKPKIEQPILRWEPLIKKIYNYKEPWTINSFADTLSNYIFKDKKYIKDSKKYYIDERKFMISELRSINSIQVHDTDTNFILIKLNNKNFIFKNFRYGRR